MTTWERSHRDRLADRLESTAAIILAGATNDRGIPLLSTREAVNAALLLHEEVMDAVDARFGSRDPRRNKQPPK